MLAARALVTKGVLLSYSSLCGLKPLRLAARVLVTKGPAPPQGLMLLSY
jgi:hypothetical protein